MRKSNVYGVRPYQEILYVDEFGFKSFDDIYLADGVVTHWMPLPQPPKKECKLTGQDCKRLALDWLKQEADK